MPERRTDEEKPGKGAGVKRITGIFSTQVVEEVQTGTSSRRTIQKAYWFVEELERKLPSGEAVLEIQPLNANSIPSGPKREIPMEDFLAKFSPEPELYQSVVYPRMRELEGTIVRGEKHRQQGRNYSAEFEFRMATRIDEENVRANFGLGLTYLARGEREKANDIFERLVKLDAAFEQEHKHLFNDFGISLRKNQMYDQALDYYLRAEDLVSNDENLFHNIARVYFEKGDMARCLEYLDKSLALNPDMEESRQFREYLRGKGLIDAKGKAVPGAGGDA